jgi:hypothetical protein
LRADPLTRDAPENAPFMAVPAMLNRVESVDGFLAALADFRAARQAATEYAAIYAYRVLEDVATSISGELDPSRRKQAWDKTNLIFGTEYSIWQPVVDAARASRHGNPLAGELVTEQQAQEAIAVAKDALDRWLKLLP